jgi:hypothetical protein
MLVSSLLDFKISKLPQLADWRLRPLPDELKEYATNDSRFLLKCWYIIISKFDVSPCSFERSKKFMQKCYRPSTNPNPTVLWRQSLVKLHTSCQPLFDTLQLRALYISLYNWREDKSKECDILPNYFLPLDKLAFITRAKPTTKSNLMSLFNNVKKWPCKYIPELLQLIKANESQVFPEYEPAPANPVVLRNFHLPDYCSDMSEGESEFSVEYMEVESQNNPPPRPEIQVHNPLPLVRQNIQVISSNNRKNVMKKIRLEGNRFRRNQFRISRGLPPIRYYKNKGRKHRIRQAERKAKQLLSL